MSKTQLKKELQQLDKESIINVVLDLYTARKEAKDYLDFFVNPDISGRMEKARIKIAKELTRGRPGGQSRARISHIRKSIKEIESLQPGVEYIADLMVYSIEVAYAATLSQRLTQTLANGLRKLVSDTVIFLDRTDQLSVMLPRLQKADESLSRWSSLRSAINDALSGCAEHAILSQ